MLAPCRPPIALAVCGGLAMYALPVHADESESAWRLFIADHTAPVVTALDLDEGGGSWTIGVDGPAKLYATPSAQLVVAVQSDHDSVAFFRSGISLDSHGDHADIEVSDPAAIDDRLEGPRPFHVVMHDDVVAINFDKGGYATLLQEGQILEGRVAGSEFPQNRAHHGFATPMGSHFVSSVASTEPTEGDAAPPRIGIQGFNEAGEPVGAMQTCTDLHGEAISGVYLLAGCKEGVVAVRDGGDAPEFAMLPYPEEFPEGHTGTLLGSAAMQIFLGNYGSDSVVIIDPTAEPYFTRVELPFRRVDFILDPAKPQHGYILTEDGSLHRLNLLSAKVEQSAKVTAPYSMDGHWRDPRPRLAMAGERLALTDPLESAVRLIDLQTLSEIETIPVDGLPYNIIAVGGDGLTH